MAAKRLPSQFPTFIFRPTVSFEEVDRIFRDLVGAIEEFRSRLTNILGDHADLLDSLQLPVVTDATRGSAGTAGRIVFNSDDGNLNIDDGTNWILPDGTTT